MLETLLQIDRALSITINHFHSPLFDTIMIAISGKLTWIPLYALLLFLIIRKFGWKPALFVLLAVVVNLVLTDQVSGLFKDTTMRFRPCKAAGVMENLHLPDGCGGPWSFVSSHATNTMGLAILMILTLKHRWFNPILILWALLNAYSRVYLGKHYILDVTGGILLGIILAFIVVQLLRILSKKYYPELYERL